MLVAVARHNPGCNPHPHHRYTEDLAAVQSCILIEGSVLVEEAESNCGFEAVVDSGMVQEWACVLVEAWLCEHRVWKSLGHAKELWTIEAVMVDASEVLGQQVRVSESREM